MQALAKSEQYLREKKLMGDKGRIHIIEQFHATKLNNDRTIYVYLPAGYDTETEERYPVIYMHDGQNIFYSIRENQENTNELSGFIPSSWRVDETADKLIAEGMISKLIIVGISHKEDRAGEYTHRSSVHRVVKNSVFGDYELNAEGRGFLYEDFILNDLMSYMNTHFRILQGAENTAMIGSSMGGLVTYNIAFRHSDVIGKIGVMSPAFFWDDEDKLIPQKKEPLKIWMDVGEGEPDYVTRTRRVAGYLLKAGYESGKDLMYLQKPMAIHTENDWGQRIPMILQYFFGKESEPECVGMYGRNELGLSGPQSIINSIVFMKNGMRYSELKGSYYVENSEVLKVEENGTIIPLREGKTRVIFEIPQGLQDISDYTVIKEQSEQVDIVFRVYVPSCTPVDSEVYIGSLVSMPIVLTRLEDGSYSGSKSFTRGIVVSYKVRREPERFGQPDRTVEVKADGSLVGIRQFVADTDKEIVLYIEGWRDK